MNIDVLSTDFSNKYLIVLKDRKKNKIFYCGELMKDILSYYRDGIDVKNITNLVNSTHNCRYDEDEIKNAIENVNNIKEIRFSFFRPLIKLFNTQKIPSVKGFLFLTKSYPYYISFVVLLIINTLFLFNQNISEISGFEVCVKYVILFGILIAHELGHSLIAKSYKINTGQIGIGIYIFLPVFYINLNEIWRLKKTKRMKINLGGIYFQLLIGLILIIMFYSIGSNMIGSIVRLNFLVAMLNLNPFVRFDGYWALADFLNDNNLYNNSKKLFRSWLSFKFPKSSKSLVIYTILRTIFFAYIFYHLIKLLIYLLPFILKFLWNLI